MTVNLFRHGDQGKGSLITVNIFRQGVQGKGSFDDC